MQFVDTVHVASIAIFCALMILAAVSDLRSLRIPNRICILVIALYPSFALSGNFAEPWWAHVVVATLVFFAGTVPFAFGQMGGGDVKLLTVAALWAGPAYILELLFVSAIAGGLLAIALMTQLRFGLAATLCGAGLKTEGNAVASGQLPYGVAIAGGGTFVAARLAGLW